MFKEVVIVNIGFFFFKQTIYPFKNSLRLLLQKHFFILFCKAQHAVTREDLKYIIFADVCQKQTREMQPFK